jgi:hypothetical protein
MSWFKKLSAEAAGYLYASKSDATEACDKLARCELPSAFLYGDGVYSCP